VTVFLLKKIPAQKKRILKGAVLLFFEKLLTCQYRIRHLIQHLRPCQVEITSCADAQTVAGGDLCLGVVVLLPMPRD
jgi:hypothetical protein